MDQQLTNILDHFTRVESWWNSAGPGVKTMVACILIGYLLKATFAKAPNENVKDWFMFSIPLFTLTCGVVVFPLVSSTGMVSPDVQQPVNVLRMNGLFYALAAWLLHRILLRRVVDRFIFTKDDEGNTQFLSRPNKANVPQAGDSGRE